ncbi:hypothetical protein ZIOFF_018621 [Zingiber officinale]|uniref:dUTP diphosphatase n=1 Tax=Zingiber officinale TaxID=94328 RepID=A0A8J5HD59_ZINOF|nr:hypothetical protein ZIOFF_018621 [Zingiber officinale]
MAITRTEQQVATTPLFEDQIRSYQRTQRRLHNAQQAARRIGRQLTGGAATGYTLEQQIEPEAQLQLSMQERASIVPAEPSEVNCQTMMDGRISLSFSNYAAAQPSEQPVYNNKDEEVQEILAVLIEVKPGVFTNFEGTTDEYYKEYGDIDDYIEKGKRIIDQDERLRIEIPYGYYGRLASRSGLAWKSGVEVGVGVIDSDYRGEVKVLLFNRTNIPIYISPHQKIAQLIPEKIALPEVYEVPHLSYSERGDKGFGSTDKPNTIPEPAQDKASTSQQPRHFTANDIFSLLMPRETVAVLVQDDSIQNNSEQDQAATTSPWVSVPQSLDPTPNYEDTDDSYLDYIAYLTSLSTSNKPIWNDYPESDTKWINSFASKGSRSDGGSNCSRWKEVYVDFDRSLNHRLSQMQCG